jgi:hypothetical protein
MKQALKVGALYFAAVFATGFVLGAIRTLWLVPRMGTRAAELIEARDCCTPNRWSVAAERISCDRLGMYNAYPLAAALRPDA